MLCYLGFVAVIFNTQIVQWTWFCPSDRMPVIRVVILSHLKVVCFQNRLAFSTRYTNKITVICHYAFPGNTVLHFIITHILFLNSHTKSARSCFSISNSKWFILTFGFLIMALDGFVVVLCSFTACTRSISRNKNNNFRQCVLCAYSPIRAFTQCHLK